MKVTHYSVSGPLTGVCKQSAIWVSDGGNAHWPLIYFQRPKWIEDDAVWNQIVASVEIKLPQNIEVK